jgi:molybdopterin synthase sulfur carrier subunit
MAITFALPNALVPFSGGRSKVTVQDRCRTVGEAIGALAAGGHAGVVDRVMDERGEVRQHVNVFVDGENIRFTEGLATPVHADSTIHIVAAVSGG